MLENQNQINQKTADFMELVADELFIKTGVKIYIVALQNLDYTNKQESINNALESTKAHFTRDLDSPYILLFFTKNEKKIDIITTKESEKLFDKNATFWDYIMPLVPSDDKELNESRISAFLLNGFLDIVEQVAKSKQVILENEFTKNDSGVQNFAKYITYFMLFTLLLLFIFVTYKGRKK
ncbi:MAG: TPM domain-containing protein [Helicobacteraceae bacterium]|nr:TPM domain-containing protein [Helicobacteraceae bacterium]